MTFDEFRFDVDDPTLAAAAWTRLIEPGDEIAGALIGELGACEALRWLIEARRSAPLLPAVAPGTDAANALTDAVARWSTRLDMLDPVGDLKVSSSTS